MARHRGTYKENHPEPYELSRSRIESFVKCPGCFWLDRVKGVKFPSIPAFLLNSATDTLLKKDFDTYRLKQEPHPLMDRHGLERLVPFQHPDFELWTKSLQLGLRTYHEKTNLIVGGGLDDVWQNIDTGQLHIVDYKSTASGKGKSVSLEGHYKKAYKRQMDVYQWILRRGGFDVSHIGYFVYVDGDQHGPDGMLVSDRDMAAMHFSVSLLSYQGNDDWVEAVLVDINRTLKLKSCPPHSKSGYGYKGDEPCEYERFLNQAQTASAPTTVESGVNLSLF